MSIETIYDGGAVYMTLPAPVPSSGNLEGWLVRSVTSVSHGPRCSGRPGTRSVAETDVESFNSLLRLLGALEGHYGYRPRSSRIGVDSYRWTFEEVTVAGHRVSDMIIASRIH